MYYRRLPTRGWLGQVGIRPSNTTQYSVSTMQSALTKSYGAVPYVGCSGPRYNETAAGAGSMDNGRTVLSEVWYYSVSFTTSFPHVRRLDSGMLILGSRNSMPLAGRRMASSCSSTRRCRRPRARPQRTASGTTSARRQVSATVPRRAGRRVVEGQSRVAGEDLCPYSRHMDGSRRSERTWQTWTLRSQDRVDCGRSLCDHFSCT